MSGNERGQDEFYRVIWRDPPSSHSLQLRTSNVMQGDALCATNITIPRSGVSDKTCVITARDGYFEFVATDAGLSLAARSIQASLGAPTIKGVAQRCND